MDSILYQIKSFFRPLFYVDKRTLGIYRVLLGILCFIDLVRRWHFIDIFYTNDSIISISTSNSFYKNFTLLSTFTTSWEVHLFFAIAIFSSVMFIIGYKTKFFQIVCTVFLISIHNRAIMLENAGDFVVNSLLVLSLFLPLGISFSLDSLKKSLKINESNIYELNTFHLSEKKEIFSIAYLGILIQLASIYFFTGLNKSGYDWSNGSAVFKMFQLDTFLTPTGYHLREYVNYTISKILTYSTMGLEFLAPILLLLPFYSYILRPIFIVLFTAFHLGIRISIKVGLFSYTMISTYILLLDKKSIDKISQVIKNKFYCNSYVLFYDTDCGFCHFSARIIKRLDIFNNIEFAGKDYSEEKPINLDKMIDYTVVLYDKKNKKHWVKQRAFGKILNTIPLGFIISWIFFIPLIERILEYIYDCIALNRTKVSKFFGFSACDIKDNNYKASIENNYVANGNSKFVGIVNQLINSMFAGTIILASLNYNLVANKSVNEYMEKYNYEKFKHNKTLRKISSYPRMIQRWNMFSPTVLGTDKTVVVEVTLTDGTKINPFTGQSAVLNSLDYPNLWHDHNQFWRKFFSRVTKKQNSKYISKFEKWIKRNGNDYFAENLNGKKIKSVKLWSLSQRNRNINSTKENKVIKRLLNKSSETDRNNKRPTKKL